LAINFHGTEQFVLLSVFMLHCFLFEQQTSAIIMGAGSPDKIRMPKLVLQSFYFYQY